MVDAVNFRKISNKLATAGTINPASFPELHHQGYKIIIDLRTEEEKEADEIKAAENSSVKYISIPIKGKEGLTLDKAKQFVEIFDECDGSVILHCATANRAGAMWAAYNLLKGENFENSIAKGKLCGMQEGWEEILQKIKQ